MTKILLRIRRPRNLIAKDLHSDKYHMRVVKSKKKYARQLEKQKLKKELAYG